MTHKELNKSFKFVCNVVSHCLSKLLEIKIYNSYEQLDIIKTELLGNPYHDYDLTAQNVSWFNRYNYSITPVFLSMPKEAPPRAAG